MKSYKLIKEYPGSHKLGTKVIYSEKYQIYNYNGGNLNTELPKNQVESLSEFWEEVIEKDYEILSYIGKLTKDVLSAKLDPFVNNKLLEWKDKNLDIYSVKRLSDGEIFTIGDKIDCKGWFGNIIKFEIINNELKIFQQQHINSSNYKPLLIQELNKFKTPLFTTEDGVDIFEGNVVYYVETEEEPELCFIVNEYTVLKYPGRFISDKSLHSFSTKEAAEEYVLMNKPCLSINDLKVWGDLAIPGLKKIVINKLKQ